MVRTAFKWTFLAIAAVLAFLRFAADWIGRSTVFDDARSLLERVQPVIDFVERQPDLWFYAALIVLVLVGLSLHIPQTTWTRLVELTQEAAPEEDVLPGLSFLMSIRFGAHSELRREYLAAIKATEGPAEASFYVSADNRLIFSVTDRFGEPHNVSAEIDARLIRYNEFNVFYAGMGRAPGYSVFSLWLNGKRLVHNQLAFPIQSDGLDFNTLKIGADSQGGMTANFDLGSIIAISRTLNTREILGATAHARRHIKEIGYFAEFRNGAFLEASQEQKDTEARKPQ